MNHSFDARQVGMSAIDAFSITVTSKYDLLQPFQRAQLIGKILSSPSSQKNCLINRSFVSL
jgi:hypothetical protein